MKVIAQLYKKYSSMSLVAKASMWFVACGVLQRCVSLLTTPIFTRLLTTTQYGQFTVYNSWLNLFSIITTFRLDYAVFNKGMSKYPNERDQYTSVMQSATNLITLMAFMCYLIFRNSINSITELTTFVTCFMFLELFFMPAIRFWTLRQRYELRYKSVFIVTLLLTILNALVGLIAVTITEDKGIARIFSCVIVETCFGICFYVINLVKGRRCFQWEYIKFAILFNVPLIPYYFSGYILQQADRLMIQKMSGLDAAAIYGVAYNVGLVMTIISNSVNSALAPWEYETLRLKDYKKIPQRFYQIMLIVFCLLIVFMAFAPEAMRILASKEYAEAVYIIPSVTASVFFMLMTDLFGNIEFFYDKNKFATCVSIFIAVINILLNYLGIKMFGYIAAGYTTLICYMLATLAHYIYVERIIKEQYKDRLFKFGKIIGITIAMIGAVIFMTIMYTYVYFRYVLIVLLLVIILINRKYITQMFIRLKNE